MDKPDLAMVQERQTTPTPYAADVDYRGRLEERPMTPWEDKVVRLSRAEGSSTWEQEADLHSAQLSALGSQGWELVSVEPWPWVVFRRKVGVLVPIPEDKQQEVTRVLGELQGLGC